MLDELDDLEIVDEEINDQEIIENDYTEKTEEVKKKLLKKIRVVFASSIIILITTLFSKHNDFDVVLKSTLFIMLLYISVVFGIVILAFTYSNRTRYSYKKVYVNHKRFLDVFELLSIVPVFMVLLTVVNVFIVSPSFIEGASMEPNYYDGEDIIFWHLNVEYKRYDVVILKAPNGNYWIKRIIGLPGDEVILEEGVVFVNGSQISQDFLLSSDGSIDEYTICRVGDSDYCEFTVPDGEYFVLGDNRNVSDDSRSTNLGYVKEEQLFGKVIFKFNNFLRN